MSVTRSLTAHACAVVLAAGAVLAARATAGGCPVGEGGFELVTAGDVAVGFRPEPAPLAVGRDFELDVGVCTVPGGAPLDAALDVDAAMPAHGHGMNYRPVVQRTGPGRYRVRGLMLHMPGRWVLRFAVRDDAGTTRFAVERDVR